MRYIQYVILSSFHITLGPGPIGQDMRWEEVCAGRAFVGRLRDIADCAARRLQRAWRRCVSDPAYQVCRTRLMREFEDMLPALHLLAMPACD